MSRVAQSPKLRCAVYTRKSSEEGLEQAFNSLHAQREACEAYVLSQQHEGWLSLPKDYDDGGFSGGNTDRPALAELLTDIRAGYIDVIIVYKVDRLSRSLADFVQLVDLFDKHNVSFVSVTQQFNTANSMGRLTLNVLLSFAQFEREVTSERIRDKICASKKKGMWMGGHVPLGYEAVNRELTINAAEAETVRHIYQRYLELGCVRRLKTELDDTEYVSKHRLIQGKPAGGKPFSRGALYTLLKNPLYVGQVKQGNQLYSGQHEAILDKGTWDAVQNKLSENRSNKRLRTKAKEPSLLAGLLYDDNGNPMSPTHTKKGSKRYRYYVSQAVLQYREKEIGSVARVPAHAVEDRVIEQLLNLLRSPVKFLEAIDISDLAAHSQERLCSTALALSQNWNSEDESSKIDKLTTAIERIEVGQNKLSIEYRRDGLAQITGYDKSSSKSRERTAQKFMITLPVKLKRCGIESRLVITDQPEQSEPAPSASVTALKSAVLKGMTWNQELITRKRKSMTEIAKREGVSRQFVAASIQLAFLSPRIIRMIAAGNVPMSLTLESLKGGFPLEWDKQEALLLKGFPA